MGGSHQALDIPCDFCIWPAVFHWTDTYPDVLLCRACLAAYPEAHTAHGTKSQYETGVNSDDQEAPA